MITFSRVRLRDAMVPGSSRCARGANEGMARALEENDDVVSAGGRAHTLVGCVFRRFAGIEPSSARAADA